MGLSLAWTARHQGNHARTIRFREYSRISVISLCVLTLTSCLSPGIRKSEEAQGISDVPPQSDPPSAPDGLGPAFPGTFRVGTTPGTVAATVRIGSCANASHYYPSNTATPAPASNAPGWISCQVGADIASLNPVSVQGVSERVYVFAKDAEGDVNPVGQPYGMTYFDSISASVLDLYAGHSSGKAFARMSGGIAMEWGGDSFGEGRLLEPRISFPREVANSSYRPAFVQVSAGGDHTCGVTASGEVYCWGAWSVGQLGNGAERVWKGVPSQVKGVGGAGVLNGISEVSAGASHTCARSTVGNVYCWGQDSGFGALGDGNSATSATPVQVKDPPGTGTLGDVVQISAGSDYSCAVKNDGSVFCWGNNAEGRLGNGTSGTTSALPVQVKDPTGVSYLAGITRVRTHTGHTCALQNTGTVYCWGNGASGRLGNGATADSTLPVQVKDPPGTGTLSGAVDIALAAEVGCAALSDGSLYCWGDNAFGQLGVGPTPFSSALPVRVKNTSGTGFLSGVQEVTGGERHLCARNTGHVFCWGFGFKGLLGNKDTSDHYLPVAVVGRSGVGTLVGVAAIDSMDKHTCAVMSAGATYCWGRNDHLKLGIGSTAEFASVPMEVIGRADPDYMSGISQVVIAAQGQCALTSGGEVYCLGSGTLGALGDGAALGLASNHRPAAAQVKDVSGGGTLGGIEELGAGASTICARSTLGAVYCWGNGTSGELGRNSFVSSSKPVQVVDVPGTGVLSNIVSLGVAGSSACGAAVSGEVFCWGAGVGGQLGNGGVTNQSRPVQVKDSPGTGVLGGVVQIASGEQHHCALTGAGAVYCWGQRENGRLGDGMLTSAAVSLPAAVKDPSGTGTLTGVRAIAAGNEHSCAITTGDQVYCWGKNTHGQLGDHSTINRGLPSLVKDPAGTGNLSNIAQVALGLDLTCALDSSARVYCWGKGEEGSLGNGGNADSSLPVQVTALP